MSEYSRSWKLRLARIIKRVYEFFIRESFHFRHQFRGKIVIIDLCRWANEFISSLASTRCLHTRSRQQFKLFFFLLHIQNCWRRSVSIFLSFGTNWNRSHKSEEYDLFTKVCGFYFGLRLSRLFNILLIWFIAQSTFFISLIGSKQLYGAPSPSDTIPLLEKNR